MPVIPSAEPASYIRMEHSLLDGTVLGGLSYGIHLTLFIECLYYLTIRPAEGRVKWHLVGYIFANFALGTIAFATSVKLNEMMFVDDRQYPGGPLGFYFGRYGDWANVMGYAASFALNWFADAMLIFRLFVFWERSWLVVAFPLFMLVGSIGLSIVLITQIAHPTPAFWDYRAVSLGTPYWALTASINIFVTLLIVGRIWYWQLSVSQILEPSRSKISLLFSIAWTDPKGRSGPAAASKSTLKLSDSGKDIMYISVVAMLIESAALSTFVGIFFIVAYVRKGDVMNVMGPILGQIVAISPLLIILRVARGIAFSDEKAQELSSVRFTSTGRPNRRLETSAQSRTASRHRDSFSFTSISQCSHAEETPGGDTEMRHSAGGNNDARDRVC